MSLHHNIIYGLHTDTNKRIFIDATRPSDKNKIKCEICESILVPKKGEKKIHHYAHKSNNENCDSWSPIFKSEDDHHWHLTWQNFFKENDFGDIEIVIKKENISHRADIQTKTSFIIEIQHSNISDSDVIKREVFYGKNMIWIIDGRNDNFNFLFYTENDYYIGKYHKEFIYSFKRNVFIDSDYGIFELIKTLNNRYCIVKRVNSNLKSNCKKFTKCFDKQIFNMNEINNKLFEYMDEADLRYINYDEIKKIQKIHFCKEYNMGNDIFILDNKYTSPVLNKCGYERINNTCYNIENENFLDNFDDQPEELIIKSIQKNIISYKYIKNKTYDLDKKLLSINGLILQFIDKQTDILCEIAVKNNSNAYQFIRNKTDELDKKLLSINGLVLQFINKQTNELCILAVKNNKYVYKFIKNKTYDLNKKLLDNDNSIFNILEPKTDNLIIYALQNNIDINEYIKENPTIINFIKKNNYELCKKLLSLNGLLLKYIDMQTDELCIIAIKNNINAYEYIKNKTYELNKKILNVNGLTIQFIKNIDFNIELLLIAIANNKNAIKYCDISILSHENLKYFLKKDGLLLQYIKEQTEDLCKIALKQNINSYTYIKNKTIVLEKFYKELKHEQSICRPITSYFNN
jgi:competence CoiA-like predicted nuclease